MKTQSIHLKDGWNPGFKSGTKVVAKHSFYTINVGDVLEYQGGCDHDDYGWAIFLKDSGLTIPASVFENYFEQIV